MGVARIGRILERNLLEFNGLAVNGRRLRGVCAGVRAAVCKNRRCEEIVEGTVFLHDHDDVANWAADNGLTEQRCDSTRRGPYAAADRHRCGDQH